MTQDNNYLIEMLDEERSKRQKLSVAVKFFYLQTKDFDIENLPNVNEDNALEHLIEFARKYS